MSVKKDRRLCVTFHLNCPLATCYILESNETNSEAAMIEDYFRQYGLIAIFTIVAITVPISMLLLSWALSRTRIRPQKPTPEKLSTYECGMETLSPPWTQFNFRFYYFALLFVIFDVETVFLVPWAVQFKQLGVFALVEMAIFVGILVVGWLYAWRKKALEW